MKKLTQKERVLRHLTDFGSITSLEAIKEYGITRLSAVIYNLKKDGYVLTDKTIKGKNRYGEPTHFKQYSFVKE